MGLARDWGRQTVRAAGVSLLAPLFLLGAAALVALTGGGLGGLGSLTEIASGPPVPLTDLEAGPRSRTLGRAQAVALRLGLSEDSTRAARGASAGTAAPGSAESGARDDTPGPREIAVSPTAPQTGVAPDVPATGPARGRPKQAPAVTPATPATPPVLAVPPPVDPVDVVVDTTRDLSEALPAPVGPSVGPALGPRR